jgi:hypothetical protein
MNERIKELAERAGLKSEIMVDESNLDVECFLTQYDASLPSIHYWEKFALLIVQECIQVGGPEDSYTDEWFNAKADSVAKIKQHFRVEE